MKNVAAELRFWPNRSRTFRSYLAAVTFLITVTTLWHGGRVAEAGAPPGGGNFDLDPAFNAKVTDSSVINYVSRVLPDGKILVGGGFNYANGVLRRGLVRLNADGTLDPTFNPTGIGPDGDVLDIALLGDGKLLIGGAFTNYDQVPASRLARLNADGSLDTTFNPGGAGVAGGRLTSLSVQADGKIVASGQNISGYNGNPSIGVFRANSDGTFDSSFVSGYATQASVEQAILLVDGKILIGSGVPVIYGGNAARSLIRVNSDGSFDATFNPGGVGPDLGIAALGLQTDGKILVGGSFANYNGVARSGIARLAADGTLDESFVPPAFTVIGFEYFGVQPDGKVLVAGFNPVEGGQLPVVRLNPDGSQDSSFNNVADNFGYHVTVQPDGKVLLTGGFNRFTTGGRHDGMVRFDPDGTVDSTFSPSLTGFGGVNEIVLQPDGKTLVGGRFRQVNGVHTNCLARLSADGTFDETFDIGTGPQPSLNGLTSVNAIALQADGKVLVGGQFSTFNNSTHKVLVRLNPDGSLDDTFILSGNVNVDLVPNIEFILPLADGKIMIGGVLRNSANQIRGLLRLTADGSVDETFNTVGNGANSTVFRILRQPDGKYVIVGNFTTYNGTSRPRVARINEDGTLDTTFSVGTGAGASVFAAGLQPDGKIVIGGSFVTYNSAAVDRVARLNDDGSLDGTFGAGGGVGGPSVNAIAMLPGGQVLIGGSFTDVAGTLRYRLARLNSDGSLDRSLYSGFDNVLGSISAISPQPDGKVLVGGTFTNYNGRAVSGVVRLQPIAPLSNGKVVFSSDRDGATFEIYSMNPNGSGQTRLTNNTFQDLEPQWSPDGTKIVFSTNRDGNREIYVMDDDGSNPMRLTNNAGFDGQPAWSPDGTRIVFRATRDANADIYVMNADGTNEVRLTTHPNIDAQPRWAPNGGTIAFSRTDAVGAEADVFVMNANGTNQVQLTSAGGDDAQPDWSPDSSQILFTSGRDGNFEVYKMNALGAGQTRLTDSPGDDAQPAWSPDGTKISFTTIRDGNFEIYTMDADGTAPVRSTNAAGTDSQSDWRAGGSASTAQFDYDGDGKTDISVFRPATGDWYINQSTAGFFGLNFGAAIDRLAPADYDGDGKTDIAVYRPSTGIWYVTNSSDASVSYSVFGIDEDLPTPADYDGDGKADISVFRPSTGTWYRTNSGDGSFTAIQFGQDGDRPTIGDFDGDGKADVAVFRPSTGAWYQLNSSDGSFFGEQFGNDSDKIAPADYDGDGKTDIAIYRPSEGLWYYKNSSSGTYTPYVFGLADDVPVAGDYDGDGKADIGVFRPSDGYWYIVSSANGSFMIFPWGQNGDIPTPNAFGN